MKSVLPANGTLLSIDLIPSAASANAVYNATAGMGSTTKYNYSNVTVIFTHTNTSNEVIVKYAMPDPATFKNRFYVAGGGGYSLSSDPTGGLAYGAAGGATNGGYDAFDYSYMDKVLYGNGSIDWPATYGFAYVALGEMAYLGKALTKNFYGMSTKTKLYTYFEGCSDGGREG